MVAHVLRLVEAAVADMKGIISAVEPGAEHRRSCWVTSYTEDHLWDALVLVYSQANQKLMRPMRMAMAAVVDLVFILLLPRRNLRRQLHEGAWQWLLPRILADQIEYLRVSDDRASRIAMEATGDAAIDMLLADDDLRSFTSLSV